MNILVTGCAGYIGSRLCESLISDGHYVTGLDNFRYGNQQGVTPLLKHSNFQLLNCDIRHILLYRDLLPKMHVIIPLAAIVGAPACERTPTLAYEVNQYSIETMLSYLSDTQRVIYPNTNSGYGHTDPQSVCTEDTPMAPISMYGQTKCSAEKTILARKNSVSLRLGTVYGISPRMRFDLLVNDFTAKVFFNTDIFIYEPEFRRNIVHIEDVILAFQYMINHQELTGAFNLSDPQGNSTKLELAKKITNTLKKNQGHIHISTGSDVDQRDYYVSSNKIINTGFRFIHTLENGIKQVASFCSLYKSIYDLQYMRNTIK